MSGGLGRRHRSAGRASSGIGAARRKDQNAGHLKWSPDGRVRHEDLAAVWAP